MLLQTKGLIRNLGRIALLACALSPAIVFIFVGYSGRQQMAEDDARFQAQRVGYAIATNPEVWRYATERLIDQIVEGRHVGSHTHIFDSNGKLLAEIGEDDTSLIVTGRAPLMDFGKVVGELKVDVSVAQVLGIGAMMSVIGLVVGMFLIGGLNRLFRESDLAESALRNNDAILRTILTTTLDGYWQLGDHGQLLDCNPAYCVQSGYSREELLRMNVSDLEANENPSETDEHMQHLLKVGHEQFESKHRRKDGSLWNVEVSATYHKEGVEKIYTFLRDITERKRADGLLRESEQHFRTLANSGSTLIWTSGLDKLCNYLNDPWLRFTGRPLERELGNGWTEGVHPEDFDHCLKTYVAAFDQQKTFSMEYRIRHADGSYRWLRDDGNPRYDSQGKFLGYIGYCVDITLHKEAEHAIKSLAFYDPLTRLPNRRLLLERLDQAMASSSRHHRDGAVLFIDLDNFKTINDTLGHHVGDLLLQEVARRLENCVRQGDTVARLGGDEFVVMLEYLDAGNGQAATQARTVGEKILAALNQPLVIDEHVCRSTPSIGVALFSGQTTPVEELLKQADHAMYEAKRAGRNMLRIFETSHISAKQG